MKWQSSGLTLAVTAAEGMRNNYMTMLTAANLELDAANLELDGDADTVTEGLRDAVTRLELALAKIEMETEAGRNAMDTRRTGLLEQAGISRGNR